MCHGHHPTAYCAGFVLGTKRQSVSRDIFWREFSMSSMIGK